MEEAASSLKNELFRLSSKKTLRCPCVSDEVHFRFDALHKEVDAIVPENSLHLTGR